jgi:hypothetical protein
MRRLGVLVGTTADPIGQARITAFHEGLQQFGWALDPNVRVDARWAGVGDAEHYRKYAAELIALAPAVAGAVDTPEQVALDSSHVKIHRCATGGKGGRRRRR